MILSPMRFKNYVWPHNPHTYVIDFRREIAMHKVPLGAYSLQCLGRVNRVLRGEGEFAGEGAYDEFKRLATVFYGNTPGLLIHPVWQESLAYFARLSLEQEPTQNYVHYSFEFWECCEEYQTKALDVSNTAASSSSRPTGISPSSRYFGGISQWVTASAGDTLWGIASRYGLSIERLISLNPQIRNSNLISAGDRIRVSVGEELL